MLLGIANLNSQPSVKSRQLYQLAIFLKTDFEGLEPLTSRYEPVALPISYEIKIYICSLLYHATASYFFESNNWNLLL